MAYAFETLAVTGPQSGVIEVRACVQTLRARGCILSVSTQVALNRPAKLNAMNPEFWRELKQCMDRISVDGDVRAVVLTGGTSRIFTAGLDITAAMTSSAGATGKSKDIGRRALDMHQSILTPQEAITSVEACRKPVIVALHGKVIGGGIDLACACDIRYCTKDAAFIIAEVDAGLAADIGTLQRMPKKIGNDSIMRELALTGRKMDAAEALQIGLVGKVFDDQAACIAAAHETAKVIAEKSPIAVVGTKLSLNYSLDHTSQEGLDHIRWWNMSMLQSEDFKTAAMAQLSKTKPQFAKL